MTIYNPIEQALLRTIAYYDIFKFPLTTLECWKFLYDPQKKLLPQTLLLVEASLKNLERENILKQLNGFWQIKTAPDYFDLRQERYRIFINKWHRARRWVRLFTFLGSVRFIAIVNSLGYQNPEPNDDIDLLVITKAKKIWLTRWWLTGFAKLFGLRPTIKHQANDLCLSFYISEQALDFKPLMIHSADVYFHFWLPHITVLFDDGVSQQLIKENQEWLKCFPNLHLQYNSYWQLTGVALKALRFLSGLLTLAWWERLGRTIQMRLLPANLKKLVNQSSAVVVSDKVLKFHSPDRREYYYKMWRSKINELGVSER